MKAFYETRNNVAHALDHALEVGDYDTNTRMWIGTAIMEIDRLQHIQTEQSAVISQLESRNTISDQRVSAVAGVVFSVPISEDMRQALHDFGEHRRSISCVDWSPPAWRKALGDALAESQCNETEVIEAIYHAIRRGWRNFYINREGEPA